MRDHLAIQRNGAQKSAVGARSLRAAKSRLAGAQPTSSSSDTEDMRCRVDINEPRSKGGDGLPATVVPDAIGYVQRNAVQDFRGDPHRRERSRSEVQMTSRSASHKARNERQGHFPGRPTHAGEGASGDRPQRSRRRRGKTFVWTVRGGLARASHRARRVSRSGSQTGSRTATSLDPGLLRMPQRRSPVLSPLVIAQVTRESASLVRRPVSYVLDAEFRIPRTPHPQPGTTVQAIKLEDTGRSPFSGLWA